MKFRARCNKKSFFWRIFIIVLFFIVSFFVTFKILYTSIKTSVINDNYINYLVQDSFGGINLEDFKLSSAEFLLKYSFGIKNFNSGVKEFVIKNTNNDNMNSKETIKSVDDSFTLYIYHTHENEEYKNNNKDLFNIKNTVVTAAYILKDYLHDLGINALVEEGSVSEILNSFNWKYANSYKASRMLLEDAYKNNPTLNFFIDIHRDSASYDITTVEINDIKYAKLMFVVGLEHDNYLNNLEVANELNEMVKSVNPSLSRGVLKKKGKGVNGKYNQDFSPNTILVEVGGEYNSIEEVNNSLKLFANILFSYLRGK